MSLQAHDWGLSAEAVPGRTILYPRGRVIGGSSAVNAAIALRGVPADYDEWAALGNDAWSWAEVLPYFRRLEDDREGSEELHGRGGPVAIGRWRREELIPTQRAFFDVCRRLGFDEVADHNHPQATGVGPFPQNRRGRLRLSTAIAYLLPARQRHNLTIRPHCLVDRVVVEHDRALGLEFDAGGERETAYGRRITHCGGRDRHARDPLALGHRTEGSRARARHRAGRRSAGRRRESDRPPGNPRAARAEAGQLRPRDAARTGRPALHGTGLERVQRHAAGHLQPRRPGAHRRGASGKGGRRAARHRAPGRARTSTLARPAVACEQGPARTSAGRAQLHSRPRGPPPAGRRRPPRLAARARAGDRASRRASGPPDRRDDGLGGGTTKRTYARPSRRSFTLAARRAWGRATTRWP